MGKTEPDGNCRWRLQRDDHAKHATGEHIDGDRQIRSANRLPVSLVDNDQINDGMVNLHLLKRLGEEVGAKARPLIEKHKDNPAELAKVLNRLRVRASEKGV